MEQALTRFHEVFSRLFEAQFEDEDEDVIDELIDHLTINQHQHNEEIYRLKFRDQIVHHDNINPKRKNGYLFGL